MRLQRPPSGANDAQDETTQLIGYPLPAMRDLLVTTLSNLLQVRRDEIKTTATAFVYLFFAIGAFIIGRITRTVLFLELPDYKQQLPLAYVGIAVSVSAAMIIYRRFQDRLRHDHTNAITLAALIVATFSFRFALRHSGPEVTWVFYFWVEIYGAFLVVQFWTLINEIYHARQAKRLFAIIGGGGVLSNIVIGLLVSGSVRSLGTENLLYLICGCLSVSFGAVIILGRLADHQIVQGRRRPNPIDDTDNLRSKRLVFETRHVQLTATVVVLTYVVSTLVDYQFQTIIGDSIPGKDDRSAYLGNFFALTGVIGGVIQFFATSRILERFGLLFSLMILPTAMALGSVGLLILPLSLAAATFTKGSENCLRYTINDSTLQLLYLPLPSRVRSRAKATIDGILKPFSIGTAGLLLAILVGGLDDWLVDWFGAGFGLQITPRQLSVGVILGLATWLVALARLRREYVTSLLQTLKKRRINFSDTRFEIDDEEAVLNICALLDSEDHDKTLQALDLVEFISGSGRFTVEEYLLALLSHPDEDIRVRTLEVLSHFEITLSVYELSPMLNDKAPRVRAAAVRALAASSKEQAISQAGYLLEDPDPGVRAATVLGFLRHGGIDGVLASAEHLKAMLKHPSPFERANAAWVLGEVGIRTFYQPLLPLLADPNEDVGLAAVKASGAMRAPELIDSLIAALERPRLERTTIKALARFDEELIDYVTPLLENSTTPRAIRVALPRVIATFPGNAALSTLEKMLHDEDPAVRQSSLAGLCRLRDDNPLLAFSLAGLNRSLRYEAENYFHWLVLKVDLAVEDDHSLLLDAIAERERRSVQRIMSLLSLLYSGETVQVIEKNLQSRSLSTRSNAVELLDNLLSKEHKSFVIPIFDLQNTEYKIAAGAELFALRHQSRNERLRDLLVDTDPWLRIVGALAVGRWALVELVDAVETLLQDGSSMCRETAIYVLKTLAPATLQRRRGTLIGDPSPRVAAYALAVVGEGGLGHETARSTSKLVQVAADEA